MLTKAISTLGQLLSLFLVLLLIGGCEGSESGTAGSGAPQAETDAGTTVASLARAAQTEITVEAMDEELDSIVQYERLSGDPGEIAAANYLVRTLEAGGAPIAADSLVGPLRSDTWRAFSSPTTSNRPAPSIGRSRRIMRCWPMTRRLNSPPRTRQQGGSCSAGLGSTMVSNHISITWRRFTTVPCCTSERLFWRPWPGSVGAVRSIAPPSCCWRVPS